MQQSHDKILLVDDSTFDRAFIQKALSGTYEFYTADSAEQMLEVIEEIHPKVVLLDVKMSGMDGFAACRALKSLDNMADCRVIFISSLESIEDKLKGFECGASDFLSKPIVPELLREKVRFEIAQYDNIQAITGEKENFFNVAMEAITSSGEVGVVLTFTRNLFATENDEQLGDLLLDTLNDLGVSVSLRLKTPDGFVLKSNQGEISELERQLLINLDKADRIYEFGRQIIFNYDTVGILIRAPIEDSAKKARYKDIIALLADSTVSYLKRLERDHKLASLSDEASEVVHEVQALRRLHRQQMESLLLQLITDIEQTYVNWDLTEQQEAVLIDTVSRGLDSLNDHRDQGDVIETKLDAILTQFMKV